MDLSAEPERNLELGVLHVRNDAELTMVFLLESSRKMIILLCAGKATDQIGGKCYC
jgi:hypothetical protein